MSRWHDRLRTLFMGDEDMSDENDHPQTGEGSDLRGSVHRNSHSNEGGSGGSPELPPFTVQEVEQRLIELITESVTVADSPEDDDESGELNAISVSDMGGEGGIPPWFQDDDDDPYDDDEETAYYQALAGIGSQYAGKYSGGQAKDDDELQRIMDQYGEGFTSDFTND